MEMGLQLIERPTATTATAMATSMVKSSIQRASNLFRRAAPTADNMNHRSVGACPAHPEDAYEAKKWEKITYAGIAVCAVLSIYNLSKGHHEYPEPPPYPYLHIHNKDFPWGPDPLFENIKKKKKKKHSEQSGH